MRIGWILGAVACASVCLAPVSIPASISVSSAATNSTQERRDVADYWQCDNRVGGAWLFGQAPSACDAASFGEDRLALSRYSALILRDDAASESEVSRYIEDLHAVLRDAAAHYIRRRKPRASPIEVVVFRRAIQTLAHQESYWTHYRIASDQRLKLMRGDLGHGHGLMQIDDRFHFVTIESGEAWDLIGNLAYALDIYYTEWENAAKAPCLSRADDYEKRARAAYSAYNGGPMQICRWTNANHRWARNDQGYHQKFLAQAWLRRVENPKKAASFNVGCEMDGGKNCSSSEGASGQNAGGGTHPVGQWIRAKANLDLRPKLSGGKRGVWLAGERAQILDFEIRTDASFTRAYRVRTEDGKIGWIFVGGVVGGVSSQDQWIEAMDGGRDGWIPLRRGRILAPSGIKIRRVPGGQSIGIAEFDSVIQVRDVIVHGETNEIYLEIISAQGMQGYIYAGRTSPEPTVARWVRAEENE
ncbi:MAG: hypothetical protein NDI61_04535 [Bdellovibrionaceae bacterium]|nr:hypothetical protein [Pseudobdellovibrionaceae bacterium]